MRKILVQFWDIFAQFAEDTIFLVNLTLDQIIKIAIVLRKASITVYDMTPAPFTDPVFLINLVFLLLFMGTII